MTDTPPRRVRIRPDQQPPANGPAGHSDGAPGSTASEVGYGRPPQEHRFKPGQSGNPAGRPKGSRNFATIVADLLSRPVRLKVGGVAQDKKILPAEAVANVVVAKAMKGDRHALEMFLRWVNDDDASRERREAIISLSDKEQAILRRMQERFSASGGQP